ncbi:Na+/H+ antiporter subunit G [Roseivivax sediminis]|uniref:Multisubunit potassium/proton antiporter, PhaG subunit n=1 Tax=Roseivivax sediminis TaxID=936889 RepID=A0A1I1W198_9RHOB|nr:Na+/H+ antiporter subunit G [Roseivivax sediminis]SFD88148.1 multisubunit potassium/proton antiporter, PhaG subunit [Roseivivax sediminis]
MTLDLVLDIAMAASLVIGALFTLVGSFGLLKLDDAMKRLHAPTKASTLGVGALLLGSSLAAFGRGEPSLQEVLILAFLFVTAPISAHFICKVNLHRRSCDTPPTPAKDQTWATLDTAGDETR